ncbi:MAG: GTPase domain-containing protein [Planctomycetaceae bacterium]|jgi:GTPase SAR1 family protein|nr:GTPase domain-containing protein [Planctomycetaceae bacterium]
MLREPLYSFLENNRFNRENSYNEQQLQEFFNQGRIHHETELWLWDGEHSRLAGTYESLFIRNRRFKERRLGIFGAKNSGKTAFLDCCTKYGKKTKDGSILINRNNYNQLPHEISTVEFSLLNNGMAWEIRTLDYSGELNDLELNRSELNRSELSRLEQNYSKQNHLEQAEKIKEWFTECDALLLLIDSTKITDQTAIIRRFLDQLRRRSPDGNRIDKPIAVVWTKSDLSEHSSAMEQTATEQTAIEQTAIEQKLEIQSIVETFGKQDTAEIFSVSIFDPDSVVRPIYWSVRKIDEMMYEKVVRLGQTPARKILNEYKSLRDIWGINRGELGEKITEQIIKITKQEKKLLLNTIIVIIIFLVIGFVSFFVLRSSAGNKRNFLDFLSVQENIKRADKWEEVEVILNNYRGFWTPRKYITEIEQLASEKKQELAIRETEWAFETAKYTIEHAELPEKIDQVINNFYTETPAPTKEQLDTLTELAAMKHRILRLETTLKNLRTATEHSADFAETKRLYDHFLETITLTDYPEQALIIEGIRAEREQIIEDERKGLAFLPATAFFEKVKRIDSQLKAFNKNDPQFKNLEEERTKIAADWERYDYDKFYQSVYKVRTATDLKRVKEIADQYIIESKSRTSLRITSLNKEQVENWLVWFDGLRRKHSFELTISQISIPKTFFATPDLKGKITVSLQIGKLKSEITIPQLDEVQKQSDIVLIPLDLRCSVNNAVWDEKKKTKIILTVSEYREGWIYLGRSVSRALCEVSDSEYPFVEFCPMPNGVFAFSNDNTTITATSHFRNLAMPLPEKINHK